MAIIIVEKIIENKQALNSNTANIISSLFIEADAPFNDLFKTTKFNKFVTKPNNPTI